MKNILISAIGGDIGYGVIKALKQTDNALHFVGFDIKKYNASFDLVDEFYLSPEYKNEDKWLDFVIGLIRKCKIDYFWPITEPEIKIVDQHRALFADVSLVINKSEILKVALDKAQTALVLKNAGVRVPKTWQRKDFHKITYPLVVKESFGCGSHSVSFVTNEDELEREISKMNNPIIQEYIGDEAGEYTLTIFSDQKIVNYIAFKRTLGFGGMSRYVELVYDENIREIAYTVAKIFNLCGSINVQMRKQDEKYYVFEINPRISSTLGFRVQLGFNDAAWWLDSISGKSIPEYQYPDKPVYGVRTVEEKIFGIEKA